MQKIKQELDSARQKTLIQTCWSYFYGKKLKIDFSYFVYGRNLGLGVAQSCLPSNQAICFLEPIFITNQQKIFTLLKISRFWKLQMD